MSDSGFQNRTSGEMMAEAQECEGLKHYWSPDYDDGDTCQCGLLYLTRVGSGGMCVEESTAE